MEVSGNDHLSPFRARPPGDECSMYSHSTVARRPSRPTLRTLAVPDRSQRRRSPPPEVSTAITAGFVTHITPPPTPGSEPSDAEPLPLNPSLFHNYLRALHLFDPAKSSMCADDAEAPTVRIKPGDVVLVHTVDPNGWADGTVLNTGERGWLPTNYCEAYDHPYLRNLLNAMTQFWDLLSAPENASLSTFVRQDYIRGLIAGVRYLLERADCLHRDAPTVKHFTGVRRMRKGLLADLSSLVQIAKRLQETIGDSFAPEVIHVLLEDLVTKACKVVTRAASFVDVWAQETDAENRRVSLQRMSMAGGTTREHAHLATENTRTSSRTCHHLQAVDSAGHLLESSTHVVTPGANDHRALPHKSAIRRSVVFTPPAGKVAHRLSLVTKDTLKTSCGTLASEKLAEVHDVCISHIAAFIGHHLHSRPSSELVATTERLVTACRRMLEVVDEIYAHDQQGSLPGQQVKKDFETKLEDLARSTQDVFRFSDAPDEDVVMLPAQTKHLINVGTSLISDAGECVVKTRQVIEQIGDFQLRQSRVATEQPAVEIPARTDSIPAAESRVAPPAISRRSLDAKMLPPPPPPPKNGLTVSLVPQPLPSPAESLMLESPQTPSTMDSDNSLAAFPLPPSQHSPVRGGPSVSSQTIEALKNPPPISPVRKDSVGMSVAGSTDTLHSSIRDSSTTAVSQVSTRATTPEQIKESATPDLSLMSSFASISSMRSMVTEDSLDLEAQLLQKTYAHELTLNKEGQVTGGSLPALVEQLTTHNVAPDQQFVIAFFLTFRKFTEPREFAQALINRFEYVGDGRTTGTPARLRIYNVFKGWLETYWNAEADKDALGEIRYFAVHKLKQVLPSAGDRLIELTRRLTESYSKGTNEGPLVSGVGKSSMSFSSQSDEATIPDAYITVKQLNALRVANGGGAQCSILDFDPREFARQITLMMMKTYCEIRPGELLSMEWGNPNTKKAKNIRKMCLLNTDISHLVSDTILASDDAKKRAIVIKQWIKIGTACLELNNYDTIMAIMCSVNSSVVQRLKKTWDLVSKKTKTRLDQLEQIVDISKNYATYRRRLDAPTAPCLPFLGIFLTDLTFVMAGNPKMRELPGSISETGEKVLVINFDMYARIAKIISHLQRFQVPYQLKLLPELQLWIENDLHRMRTGHDSMASTFHRRSLAVEPKNERQPSLMPPSRDAEIERPRTAHSHHSRDRYYFFKNSSFTARPAMPSMDVEFSKRQSHAQ